MVDTESVVLQTDPAMIVSNADIGVSRPVVGPVPVDRAMTLRQSGQPAGPGGQVPAPRGAQPPLSCQGPAGHPSVPEQAAAMGTTATSMAGSYPSAPMAPVASTVSAVLSPERGRKENHAAEENQDRYYCSEGVSHDAGSHWPTGDRQPRAGVVGPSILIRDRRCGCASESPAGA